MTDFLEDSQVPDRFIELGLATTYLDGKKLAHRFYDTKSGFDIAVFFDERAVSPRKDRENTWRIIPVDTVYSPRFDGGCARDLLYYLAKREGADLDDVLTIAQAIRDEGNYLVREIWESRKDPDRADLSLDALGFRVLSAVAVTPMPETQEVKDAVAKHLERELQMYQAYLNGEVYGYEVYLEGKPVDLYGVWGFYDMKQLFHDVETNVPSLPMETAKTPDVPAEFNTDPVLLLVRGLPGSGKSTAAKIWCKAAANRVRFENDQYQCDADGRYLFDEAFAFESKQICLGRVEHALATGRNVAVSCVFAHKSSIEKYQELAKRYRARFVVWRCRGAFHDVHRVPAGVYDSMKASMCDWPGEFGAWSLPGDDTPGG